MSPVLPLPRAMLEIASRTSSSIDALNELALMRQQHACFLPRRYALGDGQELEEGNDPFGTRFLPGEPWETGAVHVVELEAYFRGINGPFQPKTSEVG